MSRDSARLRVGVVLVAASLFQWGGRAQGAVVFGQLDDFEDGTTMGWGEGFSSINEPTNVATGGPQGDGDAFVQNVASGGFGAGSRQLMFNADRWAGNYVTAGITRITGWAANQGSSPLHVRIAFDGNLNRFSSTNAIELPPDGVWRRVTFDLTTDALTRVQGSAELDMALANVTQLRLLSAAAGPSYMGDPIASTLAFDDLRAARPGGDANFDGIVNNDDLLVVRSNLGIGSGATWGDGDFNFDGRVNAKDLEVLRRRMTAAGPATAGAVLTPEPTAGMLLALGGLLLRRTRPPANAH